MAELLTAIFTAIESGNIPELESFFESLNLNELTPDRQWRLFNALGAQARQHNNPEAMLRILEKWEAEVVIEQSNGPMEFNSYLFLQPLIEPEVLEYGKSVV